MSYLLLGSAARRGPMGRATRTGLSGVTVTALLLAGCSEKSILDNCAGPSSVELAQAAGTSSIITDLPPMWDGGTIAYGCDGSSKAVGATRLLHSETDRGETAAAVSEYLTDAGVEVTLIQASEPAAREDDRMVCGHVQVAGVDFVASAAPVSEKSFEFSLIHDPAGANRC